MPRRTACLTAALLAACAPPATEPRVMVATEVVAASVPMLAAPPEADLAGDARAFFFGQADLYLAGASPTAATQLADVLRAMGRDDLVDPGLAPETVHACPRQWVEPIEMIARAAASSRIVIIESERNAAAQTAFLKDLVTRLAQDGFTAFADDGLTLGPGGAAHPDVLLVSEGLVTRDPGHGRLVREVKRHRLQLVDAGVWWTSADQLASLSPAEQSARRQAGLVKQVSRLVFGADPGARVIMHIERATESPAATVKSDVARETGHEPLLIALTVCAPADAEPAFVPAHGDGASPGGEADMTFAIPHAEIREGRRTSGGRESVIAVPPAFLVPDLPVLIEARRTSDPALAIPEDRLMLFPGDRLPLLLPPGDYRIEAWTKAGPFAEPVIIRVG
ncbi:MAG: hypothetical protein Q8L84_00375 [Hyphomonas sp.]|nr:hypothetical protein [Hyphomonas sp.]